MHIYCFIVLQLGIPFFFIIFSLLFLLILFALFYMFIKYNRLKRIDTVFKSFLDNEFQVLNYSAVD